MNGIPWVLGTLWALSRGSIVPTSRHYRSNLNVGHHSSVYSTRMQMVQEHSVLLSSEVRMQVLVELPPPNPTQKVPSTKTTTILSSSKKPPILFLHGSFHAAWCWAEHYMPYLAQKGYPCLALSFRGTGGTPLEDPDAKKVPIQDHVQDFKAILGEIPHLLQPHPEKPTNEILPPIVVCHSFGGLALMKYLEQQSLSSNLSGVVTFCVVPPSGNGKMTLRFLRRSLRDSWKVTRGLAMKQCLTDANLCRELFFDDSIDETKLHDYMSFFKRDSRATIDLMDLAKQLPSKMTDATGRFLKADDLPPIQVVGAKDDFIVDREGVLETARYFDIDPVFVDSPHDVMLGEKWENGARVLHEWIQTAVEPRLVTSTSS